MITSTALRNLRPAAASFWMVAILGWHAPHLIAEESVRVVAEENSVSQGAVYVRGDRALLYSGPNQEHYATERVASGTRLEVFHKTNDGWLGIRPPADSFSWVPASNAVLVAGGKTIEITAANAVSLIGTNLGKAKQYRWQVQLTQGEKLRVKGEANAAGENGGTVLWYRVAPPAGEFRWIQLSDVTRSPTAEEKPDTVALASTQRSNQSSTPGNLVQSAQYSVPAQSTHSVIEGPVGVSPGNDVFDSGSFGSPEEIEFYEEDGQQIFQGGVIYESADGDYIPGEVIVENGPSEVLVGSSDPFAGWHAIEFTDAGMRFPWLSRLLGGNYAAHNDPLEQDPFSLATNKPRPKARLGGPIMMTQPVVVSQPVIEQGIPLETQSYRDRKHPWRDPGTLRQSRQAAERFDDLPPPNSTRPRSSSPREAPPVRPEPTPDAEAYYGGSSAGRRLTAAQNRIETLRTALKGSFKQYSPSGLSSASTTSALAAKLPAADSRPSSKLDWYGVSGASAPRSPAGLGINTPRRSVLPAGRTVEALLAALSETVAQPTASWNLDSLAAETRQLIQQGASALERGQARLLLERIEEFQRAARKSGLVADRSRIVGAAYTQPLADSRTQANQFTQRGARQAGEPQRLPATGAAKLASQYDATGWIVAVHAAAAGQPPYALVDEAGQILAYVSTLPGMKLDVYLNQAVGINGLRGYLPQSQTAHIQAQQIRRLK